MRPRQPDGAFLQAAWAGRRGLVNSIATGVIGVGEDAIIQESIRHIRGEGACAEGLRDEGCHP